MKTAEASGLKKFAAEFVRAYWEIAKSNEFSMPPNEPVEETVEELLAAVSHKVESDSPATGVKPSCKIHMWGQSGDWWDFGFKKTTDGWSLVDAAARSDDDTRPHNLLGTEYAPYFEPFLRHVTEVANKRAGV